MSIEDFLNSLTNDQKECLNFLIDSAYADGYNQSSIDESFK